jgi:3-deoxy-D-manno-octulosonic-acid transferase
MRAAWTAAVAVAGAACAASQPFARGEKALRGAERRGEWIWRRQAGSAWLWIHAASYGETEIGLALASALAPHLGGASVVMTATTATGRARATANQSVEAHYFPLDYAPYLNRILEAGAPRALVIVETEIWPETLRILARRGVPVAVANARISERSFPRYRRLAPLVGPLLDGVAKICARDDEAAGRWKALGARESAVEVTGNIKFDLALPADASALSPLLVRDSARPVFLAASTHDGEEQLALDAFHMLRGQVPGARLIVAPRHPERAADVAALARTRSSGVFQWSDCQGRADAGGADIVVLDRLGLLRAAYAGADACFVGGSITAGPGGHNLLEPVVAGCPVATGPLISNVEDQAAMLRAAGALRIVRNVEELAKFWTEAAEKSEDMRQRLAAATRILREARGALARTVTALAPVLEGRRR